MLCVKNDSDHPFFKPLRTIFGTSHYFFHFNRSEYDQRSCNPVCVYSCFLHTETKTKVYTGANVLLCRLIIRRRLDVHKELRTGESGLQCPHPAFIQSFPGQYHLVPQLRGPSKCPFLRGRPQLTWLLLLLELAFPYPEHRDLATV